MNTTRPEFVFISGQAFFETCNLWELEVAEAPFAGSPDFNLTMDRSFSGQTAVLHTLVVEINNRVLRTKYLGVNARDVIPRSN